MSSQISDFQWDESWASEFPKSLYKSNPWYQFLKAQQIPVHRILMEKNHPIILILKKKWGCLGVFWCPNGELVDDLDWLNKVTLELQGTFAVKYVLIISSFKLLGLKNSFIVNVPHCIQKHAPENFVLKILLESERQLDNLTKNWRHNLRRSEKTQLRYSRWTDPDSLEVNNLLEELGKVKGVNLTFDEIHLKKILSFFKEQILFVRATNQAGQTVALRATIIFHDWAFDFIAASGIEGRKTYASYGVFWKMIEILREKNISFYDLSGADQKLNKGVFDFKKGTGAHYVVNNPEAIYANHSVLNLFIQGCFFVYNQIIKVKKRVID